MQRSAHARVAVAATGRQSLEAGLAVAEDGGNAVDAAMAAALVALATEPGMVSFGGGAYLAVWPVGGSPVVVDGNVEMPGRGAPAARFGHGLREVVTDYGGGVTLYAGHGSVATPGVVPAFGIAHQRYATLPWPRLLAPAVSAARDGYPMSPAAARYLAVTAESLFGDDPEAHALLTRPGGGLLAGGEATRNPLLADILEELAAEGPALFSTGAVARALVRDMAEHGGLVTAADLASYRPVIRPAHLIRAGRWRVATNPPPAVGGPMLAVMLGELARRGDWSWREAIEIQRAVLGYRLAVHDLAEDLESAGTALLAAVDADGNACGITMSIGYGAGMCIPGTGILLNNSLGEVELNRLGLHAVPPGTRLASNMAPTTARSDAGHSLAVGSPGADRITTALMLVLGQACLHGQDLRHAIDNPRLHVRMAQGGEFRVEFERDPGIAAAVADLGLDGHEYPEPHMYFGGVGAACRHPDGSLQAAGDARREAATGVA